MRRGTSGRERNSAFERLPSTDRGLGWYIIRHRLRQHLEAASIRRNRRQPSTFLCSYSVVLSIDRTTHFRPFDLERLSPVVLADPLASLASASTSAAAMQPNAPASRAPRSTPAPKRRPGRPPTYVFDRPDSELTENERRLRSAVLKRRQRQNRSYRRRKLAKEALAARSGGPSGIGLPLPLPHPPTDGSAAPGYPDLSLPHPQLQSGLAHHLPMPSVGMQHLPAPAAPLQHLPSQPLQHISQPAPPVSHLPGPLQRPSFLPRLGEFARDSAPAPAYPRGLPDFSRSLPDPTSSGFFPGAPGSSAPPVDPSYYRGAPMPAASLPSASLPTASLPISNTASSSFHPAPAVSLSLPLPTPASTFAPGSSLPLPAPGLPSPGASDALLSANPAEAMRTSSGSPASAINAWVHRYYDAGPQPAVPFSHLAPGYDATTATPTEVALVQ